MYTSTCKLCFWCIKPHGCTEQEGHEQRFTRLMSISRVTQLYPSHFLPHVDCDYQVYYLYGVLKIKHLCVDVACVVENICLSIYMCANTAEYRRLLVRSLLFYTLMCCHGNCFHLLQLCLFNKMTSGELVAFDAVTKRER